MHLSRLVFVLCALMLLPACATAPGGWEDVHSGARLKEDINGYIGPY